MTSVNASDIGVQCTLCKNPFSMILSLEDLLEVDINSDNMVNLNIPEQHGKWYFCDKHGKEMKSDLPQFFAKRMASMEDDISNI